MGIDVVRRDEYMTKMDTELPHTLIPGCPVSVRAAMRNPRDYT